MSQLEVANNLDILLKISEYLIEPAILIQDHCYTNNGELKIIINKTFSNNQINDYIKYLNNKYNYKWNKDNFNNNFNNIKNSNKRFKYTIVNQYNLFLTIINEIYNMNTYWRNIQHTIYIDNKYIENNWKNSHLYFIDNYSFNNYYNILDKKIYKYDLNFNRIEQSLYNFYQYITIKKLQFHIHYWGQYFKLYLDNINNDLNQFKVSSLISLINEEERILRDLLLE